MVAIVTGNGVGLQRSSGFVLGSNGTLGDSSTGRLGSNVTVNAATGNLIIQNQDELLVGRGPDSVFMRSYNSLGLLNDENGDNWRESSQRTVVLTSGTVNTTGSTATRTDWDGSNIVYTWDATRSAYVSKDGAGAYDTLTFASNVWTWTDGNSRVVDKYDSANSGRINSSQDIDGNTLSFAYTGSLLTKVTTANGDYTELSYTGSNLTQLITKNSGGTVLASRVRYAYDTSNRLTSVTVDLSPSDNSITDNNVITYTYTYDGTSKRVASISETGSTGTNGIVSFEYTLIGPDYRITKVKETGSDGGTRDTSFSYNTTTRVTTVTDALGKATELTYDTNGNLTQVKYPPAVSGASQQIVQYAYNANGDVTSITDAGGKVTAFTYDTNGNLTQQRDAAGVTIDRTYDANNQLLNEIRYLTPDPDGAGSGTASNPVVTRRAYDPENHLRFVVDPEGFVTEYRYNAAGQLVCTYNFPSVAYTNITTFTATTGPTLTQLQDWAAGLAQTDKDLVQSVQTIYDYRGNVTSTVEFQGYIQPTDTSASGGSSGSSSPTPTYENRVHFSEFESDEHGWEAVPGSGVTLLDSGTDYDAPDHYMWADFSATAANQTASLRTDSSHSFYVNAGERIAIQAGGNAATSRFNNMQLQVSYFDASNVAVGSPVTVSSVTSWGSSGTILSGFDTVPTGAVKARLTLVFKALGSGSGWAVLYKPMVALATSSQTTQPSFEAGSTSDDMSPPSSTPPVTTYNNRVHFSNFESDMHGWEFTSSGMTVTDAGTGVYLGKNYIAADITATAANQTATVRTDSTHSFYVTAGERLAVQAGATSSGVPFNNAKLYVTFYDSTGTAISGSPVLIDTKTSITTYNTRMGGFVDAPTGAVKARLELTVTSSASGSGWFDLVEPMVSSATSGQTTQPSFEAGSTSDDMSPPSSTPPATTYNNRVHFSQFESDVHGWEFTTSGMTVTDAGTDVYLGKHYIAADITATAANQTATVRTDSDRSFYVSAGERLAIQAGATSSGVPFNNAKLYVTFFDNTGNVISGSPVLLDTKTNITNYNTRMGGFVNAPTGAVKARLELTVTSSASGSGWFDMIEPMVSSATSGQTTQPSFEAGSTSDDMSPPPTPPVTVTSLRTTSYVYDQFGLLLSRQVSGILGSEVYTYDGLGRTLTATDFANATTTTAVNDGTRTTTVTLANGLVKTSTYTAQGELASYAESGSDITTETETYKYDNLGRLRTANDALTQRDFIFYDDAGRKVGYLDRRGFLTEYQYDAANRIIATIFYTTQLSGPTIDTLYDAGGNPTAVALTSVRPTQTSSDLWSWNIYDSADRLVETISGTGAVTLYAYDGDDRLVQTTRYANVIAAATITGYKTATPTAIVTPTADATHDQVLRYFYDKSGRNIGTLDGTGSLTQINYSKAGRAIETIAYASFVSSGLRASGTFAQLVTDVTTTPNAADRHSYVVYNGRGDVRYTLDANLRPTEYVYDKAGNVLRTIDYGAAISSGSNYTLSYVQGQISTLNLAANAATRITRHVYDSAGHNAYDIDAEGYVSAYGYNAVGQIIKQTVYATKYTATDDPALSAMQSWATTNANAADRVVRQVFDALGRLAYEVDAASYVTEHQYDLNDRLTKDIRYAGQYTVADGVTKSSLATLIGSPVGSITKLYAYDASGNLTDVTNSEGAVTHYGYDSFGRATSIKEAYGTGDEAEIRITFDAAGHVLSKTTAYGTAEAATTSYSYDGVGNINTITDPRNNVTTRDYDANGNMITETVPLDASTNAVTSRQYDAFGAVVRLTDPRNNAGYFYYDKLGRLDLQIDAEGYATQTTYNIGDQPLTTKRYYQRATGTGSVTTRPTLTTDAKDATTTVTYDKLDRVIGTTDAENFTESYTLNAFGDRIAVTNKLGGTTHNVFDKRGLLIQETLPVGSYTSAGVIETGGTNIVNQFSYDARGNRTQMIEAFGLAEQRTTNYGYDKNNRLTSRTGDTITVLNPATMTTSSVTAPGESYTYDLRGNLILTVDATGAKTFNYYDDNDRKTASISAVGTVSAWAYDLNGNVTSAKVYGTVASPLPTSPGGTITASYTSGVYRETTYAYDKNNRQTASNIRGLVLNGVVQNAPIIGSYNGTNWVQSAAPITAQNIYDAAGNLIQQIDANGNTLFSYYDKNGRKIAQVDQSKYLTAWALDTEGNVLTETRYANAATGTVTSSSVPSVVADGANDRITTFTYDRAGRRLTETRKNVQASTVTGNSVSTTSVDATITYTYNGLGEVLTKTEATGDTTTYGYDAAGRQTNVTGPSFTDFNASSVQQQLVTFYDGLNNVSRTAQNGSRVTTYSYGAGGRLSKMTDPTGFATSYFYDADGRLTATGYARAGSNTALGTAEAKVTRYDGVGRIIGQATFVTSQQAIAAAQALATTPTGTWTQTTDTTEMFYNGYGDMIARGVNSGGNIANAQEYADYDAAGRIWRTNFNDGVGKAYFYDANGNATLLLQTRGSVDIKSYASQGAAIGALGSGITGTISVYDARNKLTDTIQTTANNSGANPVHATLLPSATDTGIQYFGGSLSVNGSNLAATGASGSYSGIPGSLNANKSSTTSGTVSVGWGTSGFTISWGDDLPFGNNTIHAVCSDNGTDVSALQSSHQLSVLLHQNPQNDATIYVYQEVEASGSQVLIAQFSIPYVEKFQYKTYSANIASAIEINAQNPLTTSVRMFVRAAGSSGAYQAVSTSQITPRGGGSLAGYFKADGASPPFNGFPANTAWDVKYYAMDSAGNTLNSQTATLSTDSSGRPSFSNVTPKLMNGPGQAMLTREGSTDYLVVNGLSTNTSSVLMHYRTVGSPTWSTTSLSNGGYGQNGLWVANVTGWSGNFEYWIEPRNSGGVLLGGKSNGTFTVGGQPSGLTQYADLPETVTFTPPIGQTVTSQRFRYYAGGTWSGWIGYGAGGNWNYDAAGLVPDRFLSYGYPIQYETYNGSTIVSHTETTITLGYGAQSAGTITNSPSVTAKVKFAPQQGSVVSKIRLYWRDQGTTGLFQPVDITISGGVGYWDVDAAGVRPTAPGTTRNLEYYYDAYDSSNTLLATVSGTDHVQGKIAIQSDQYVSTSDTEMYWQVDVGSHPTFTIHRGQSYNAFGEIRSETDGRGNVTTFTYNTEGKLLQKSNPIVGVTGENGVTTNLATNEYYYYDKSGRQVGQRDANGNLVTRSLLAGSGYGGSDATALTEYRFDGSTQYGVDVFGDVRKVTDGLGKITLNFYDAASRLIEVDHATRVGGNSNGVQAKDYYGYDGLGQRTRHWNAQLGSGVVETTDYDAEGRVTSTKSLAGLTTGYSYTYYNGSGAGPLITTPGLGNFGGWQTATTNSAGRTSYENKDIFGRVSWKQDFSTVQDVGGIRTTTYDYDKAGHLKHQASSSGQSIDYSYYANGYIASVTDNVLKMKSTFEYDADGNRTVETYNSTDASPKYYQNAVISYDAQNRVTRFLDAKADINYKYDAVGNRRNVNSYYHDGLNGSPQTQDYWYKYDASNRFVLTMGQLAGGQIVLGATAAANNAVLISYDAAGNRATATNARDGTTESYSYTADGYLENVSIAGVVRSKRTSDAMGRVTGYVEYADNGTTEIRNRSSTYDADNRVTDETLAQAGSTTTTHNDYRLWNGSAYAGADQGVIQHSSRVTGSVTEHTSYFYSWWDEAKQDTVKVSATNPTNRNAGNWAPGFSKLDYDVNGHVAKLTDYGSDGLVNTGDDKISTFQNDAYGQVLVRETKIGASSFAQLGPRQLYYYFNGHRIGDVGNDGMSPTQFDYAQVLAVSGAKLSDPKGTFRYGKPVASADFDANYQPINDTYPGQAASIYTVNAGDTLQSIAQAAWGDAAMWYLIADANGLTAAASLQAGQRLIIPNKVANFHNNASTFKVYDPGEAIGDTMPTLPPQPAPPAPKHKHGCGVFGMILLAVVAVAVTVVTAGAAAAVLAPGAVAGGGIAGGIAALGAGTVGLGASIVAGAVGAVAGSVVSQGLGVATGLQDKFSWKGVALAAIAGAVTGGLAASGAFAKVGSPFLQGALRGAASNVATQGLAVATGLQNKFDWTGVAVGAVAGGTMGAVNDSVKLNLGSVANRFGTQLVSGMAGAIAGGATRSLIDGTDFGDNIMAALPDVIGQTVGNLVAAELTAPSLSKQPRLGYDFSGFDDGNVIGGGATAMSAVLSTPQASSNRGSSASGGSVSVDVTGGSSADYINPTIRNFGSLSELYGARNTLVAVNDDYFAKTGQNYADFGLHMQSFAAAEQQLLAGTALADAETAKFAFSAWGGPMLLAGGAVATPAIAGYAGSFYVGGTASSIASGGAGFVTGGTFGAGFEYSKNLAFGLQGTTGGYTTAILGGGLGGTGLRLLPNTVLGQAVSARAQTVALGAFSGGIGDLAGQMTDGGFYNIDYRRSLLAAGLGGGVGAITPLEVRINGFTSGRNSSLSIYQGLNTRLDSGNIVQMRLRYPVAAGAGNAVVGSGQQAVGVLIDGTRQRMGR